MATKIRLARHGRKKSPHYKVVVVDQRKARESAYIDLIGYVNPKHKDDMVFDVEKARAWIGKGAQTSEIVKKLMKRAEKVQLKA